MLLKLCIDPSLNRKINIVNNIVNNVFKNIFLINLPIELLVLLPQLLAIFQAEEGRFS